MSDTTPQPAALGQESYIVNEGKKRGSTRDVRMDAAHDKYYTVLRVHAGDALLTDNWHTNEVLNHARNNFEGYTFAVRTLEAWGAVIENERAPTTRPAGACGCWTSSRPPARSSRLPGTGAAKK